MSKEKPDYHDADLILKLYDLRREEVMRKSRDLINGQFWPKSYEDVKAVATNFQHEMNAAYRQVSSYWEMVYSFARHGVMHPEFSMENTGEGLFLFAKILPYLDQIRKDVSPLAFVNAEWMTKNTEQGRKRFEMIQARVKKMAESK